MAMNTNNDIEKLRAELRAQLAAESEEDCLKRKRQNDLYKKTVNNAPYNIKRIVEKLGVITNIEQTPEIKAELIVLKDFVSHIDIQPVAS